MGPHRLDDTACVAEEIDEASRCFTTAVRALSRIGLRLNMDKCEALLVDADQTATLTFDTTIPIPSEGWVFMPVPPLGADIGKPQPCVQLGTTGCHSIATVHSLFHLGHPITTSVDTRSLMDVIEEEFLSKLHHFHNHPLPIFARVQVLNNILPPKLLYRLECLPLDPFR